MYQLIIVDDESLAIKALQTCIEWTDIGVAKVFTANSSNQAKEIFKHNRIDIMLCDIEMPQENGLELLAWVKQNNPETEAIIQSCHSEFKYAKKAIQLDSVDYILKPVLSDDLLNALNKAIKKIELNKKISGQDKVKESGHVLLTLPDLLKDSDNIDVLFLKKTIETQTDLPENDYVLPSIIITKNTEYEVKMQQSKIISSLLSALNNICNNTAKIIELDDNVHLILLSNYQFKEDYSKIEQIFESVFQNACRDYGLDFISSIGYKVCFSEITPVIKDLLQMCKSNISSTSGRVSLLSKELSGKSKYLTPDISYWAMLLEAGLQKKLLEEANTFFYNIPETLKTNTNYLREIREDILQMMITVLKQKGVQTQQLFYDNLTKALHDRSVYSVNDMAAWINHVVACSVYITKDLSKEHSIIEKSIRYIKLHIDQDIKREDVSAYVYLNPDYLTRIFKKETGMSITEYTINERIKIAKKLLENTNMPVSSIALRVGYANFSHFAKTFRKHTGMNPIEFKNSLKGKYSVSGS